MYIGTLEPASNQATFRRDYQVLDDETDEEIDLTDATITYEIRDQKSGTTILSAATDDGIALTSTSTFQVLFTKDDMRTLDALSYDIGCTVERSDDTEQLFIATISILDGITQ